MSMVCFVALNSTMMYSKCRNMGKVNPIPPKGDNLQKSNPLNFQTNPHSSLYKI